MHSALLDIPDLNEIVIIGLTVRGARFRPSDWAERLCGVVSQFSRDQRIRYSPYVTPVVAGGLMCVVVDTRLRKVRPEAYEYLMWFAKDNDLQLRAGRIGVRATVTLAEAGVQPLLSVP